MPPKATAETNDSSKMFSADVVAACLMASGTTSLSMKQYEMMSALDGTRTASSFQHAFRAVLAKSKELKARVDAGETFAPVQPTFKRSNAASPATPATPATPKKRKGVAGDDGTPSKKKATPRGRGATVVQPQVDMDEPSNSFGATDEELQDMEEFIKSEQQWELEHSYI